HRAGVRAGPRNGYERHLQAALPQVLREGAADARDGGRGHAAAAVGPHRDRRRAGGHLDRRPVASLHLAVSGSHPVPSVRAGRALAISRTTPEATPVLHPSELAASMPRPRTPGARVCIASVSPSRPSSPWRTRRLSRRSPPNIVRSCPPQRRATTACSRFTALVSACSSRSPI